MHILASRAVKSQFKGRENGRRGDSHHKKCIFMVETRPEITLYAWSRSKSVVNFPWKSLQRSRENYFRNFGVSLRETNRQKKNRPSKNTVSSI